MVFNPPLSPKLVLAGNSEVGKTALVRRFVTDSFGGTSQQTVGADLTRKKLNVRGRLVELAIWDTAGQEVYRSLTPQYFRDASLAIIVFSVVDEESFNDAQTWITSVRESAPLARLILAGNKIDLAEQVIDYDRANEFATENGLAYVETSAVTGQGVTSVFETLVEMFIEECGGANVPVRVEPEKPEAEPGTCC
jgi:small GTP-binding protein